MQHATCYLRLVQRMLLCSSSGPADKSPDLFESSVDFSTLFHRSGPAIRKREAADFGYHERAAKLLSYVICTFYSDMWRGAPASCAQITWLASDAVHLKLNGRGGGHLLL